MNKILAAIIYFMLVSGHTRGQDFMVHLDKPFYVAGDVLWYKIYDLKPPKDKPVLLYLDLVNNKQSRIVSQVVTMDSSGAWGSFYLPIDLVEGVYLLQYYRVWDALSGETTRIKSGSQYIMVFNDLAEGDEDNRLVVQDQVKPMGQPLTAKLKTRSSIQLPLSLADHDAGPGTSQVYSISVMQSIYPEPLTPAVGAVPVQDAIDEKIFRPRTSLVLEGKVVDPKKNTPLTEKFLSFYLPRMGLLKRFRSRNGQFKIEIPNYYGTAQYQVLSLNPNRSYPLLVVPSEPVLLSKASFPEPVPHSPAIREYLRQNNKRRLINDIFHIQSTVVATAKDSVKLLVPDRQYLMKDFQQLNTVNDFIREVLLDHRLTSLINDKKSLRMRNKETNELYHWPAWYMMNGFFAGHENEVLQMDLSKVKSIELFQRNQTITDQLDSLMVYTGLFALKTAPMREMDEKFGVLKFQLNGIAELNPWTFDPINEPRTPDLRSLLYWNPALHSDPSGNIMVDFYTSDLKGVFEIKLKGLDRFQKPFTRSWWVEVE